MVWHTVSMLEWSDVQTVDGLKLRLVASTSGIRAIAFHRAGDADGAPDLIGGAIDGAIRNQENRLLAETYAQLQAYFAGRLR